MEKQIKKVTLLHDGFRLDAFVSSIDEKISRTLAQTLIKDGEILLNDKKAKVSSKVHEGDEVTIPNKLTEEVNRLKLFNHLFKFLSCHVRKKPKKCYSIE